MSVRSAAPSADNFLDDDNDGDDLGMDFEDVPAQSHHDVLDELHPAAAMDEAFDDDDDQEGGAPIALPMGEQLQRPIGELLSAIALQGISAHAKKRPLSALDDGKLVSMYRRLSSLLETQEDAKEAEAWRSDVRILEAAAAAREINLLALPEPAPSNEELGRIARGEDEPRLRSGTTSPVDYGELVMLAIDVIAPDPAQARDEGADDDLADLIAANGFYRSKPIEVRLNTEAAVTAGADRRRFMIVDGERRYRAAVKAGLTEVPAMLIEDAGEGDRLLRQVNSNEGKRLKPMEEARTYKRIMAAKGWNLQQLATHLGKSKSTVGDRVAMAEAPAPFQPLFEDGTLSASAAPILRRLVDLPEKTVQGIVDSAQRSWRWRNADEDGKTLPLKVLEEVLAEEFVDTLPEIHRGDQVAKAYTGPVITMDKRQFAADFETYERIQKEILEKATAKENAKLADAPARSAKRERSDWEIRQAKAQAEARKKAELKRLQVATIVAKLPTSIDGKWAAFVVEYLLKEMHHDSRKAAFKLLGLEAKKTTRGVDFSNAIVKHSEKLDAGQRVKLILQLLLAGEIANSWSSGRIKDAAALAKVDLKKVKIPAQPKTKPAKKGR